MWQSKDMQDVWRQTPHHVTLTFVQKLCSHSAASTAIVENPPPAAVAISVTQPEVSTSLMVTALVTASHGERKTTARAFLDTGADIS